MSTSLEQTASKLASCALQQPLSALDAALLVSTIAASPTARDHALATLAGHDIKEDPSWLTSGPNNHRQLETCLSILEQLANHCDDKTLPQIQAMKAWTLWALHRPATALNTLNTIPASRFSTLLTKTIAVCPMPKLEQE